MRENAIFRYATVLLYMDGMAIAEDPDGDLVYAIIPEEYVEVGEAIELAFTSPISTLPTEKAATIRAARNAIPAEMLDVLNRGIGGLGDENI